MAKRRPAERGGSASARGRESAEDQRRSELLEWVKSFGIAVILFFVIQSAVSRGLLSVQRDRLQSEHPGEYSSRSHEDTSRRDRAGSLPEGYVHR